MNGFYADEGMEEKLWLQILHLKRLSICVLIVGRKQDDQFHKGDHSLVSALVKTVINRIHGWLIRGFKYSKYIVCCEYLSYYQ